jgi:hypothetical protein
MKMARDIPAPFIILSALAKLELAQTPLLMPACVL